jgi:serine protease
MSHRRWSLAALIVAPLLALGACDQIGQMWDRVSGGAAGPGPAPLDSVPLDARALAGSVQPQDQIAALLAPEPVLVAPGEIVVGAMVEQELAETASEMGLASNFIRSLRANGVDALEQLPAEMIEQVRARAEAEASETARNAARDVLGRLGVEGAIEVRPGGLVTVNLAAAGASPTAFQFAQEGANATADAQALPDAIEWSDADRCPRIVSEAQLEADVALATRCAIQRLRASGNFEYVEPNYIATSGFSRPPSEKAPANTTPAPTQPPTTTPPSSTTPSAPAPTTPAEPRGGAPNDPLYALQWHYLPNGTGEGQSPGGAGFSAFWNASQVGSRTVRVAVIDTGLDLTHPDIAGSANVAPGVDLITNPERGGDGDGVDADAQDAGDRCGTATENSYHGTHVAGTVGAAVTNDRVGVAGAAWDVTIVPVRTLGRCGGELADIVSGIRWAAGIAPAVNAAGQQIVNRNPADIINMSLSLQATCPASMQAAIDAAVARNIVVVVAAGNKANQTALYAPANCNNVIVVAAGDARGQLTFYSNFGPQVDIIAPGGDLFADSDSNGRPDGVLSTRATSTGCYDPLNQNSTERCYYSFLQGTSMATPHVSAALALLAAQTGLRGRQLEDALFTRAVAPLPPEFGQIECARSRNATPIAAGSPTCARPSGRGRLDLGLALAALPRATP